MAMPSFNNNKLFSSSNPRYLNEKQKTLILAYAELEDDVNGTVSGVEKSDKGEVVSIPK